MTGRNATVLWKPRKGVTTAALAVCCPTCDARIGQPCAPLRPNERPHTFRGEIAEEHGFVDVKAAGPLFEGKAP